MSKTTNLLLACLTIFFLCDTALAQEKLSPKQINFFEKKIRPVLVNECYSCHSKDAKQIKGGLALDTKEGIRAGGDSGPSVVPGDIDGSILIEAIHHDSYEMPPQKKLPDNVIADFETWIKMGAPDPRRGESLIKREIDFEEGKSHWAFQKIQKPALPETENASWARDELDHFVLHQLEANSLSPVGDADRQTLIRRLYFDLTGLPPTALQLKAASEDQSPNAIEKLVDRLLNSDQFGERWGRHWLDVVRYAESNGRERNFLYPNAWRYRDYVIKSFNNDKPYDQFIHEQIAGDLLKHSTNEQKVATGFLALGPKLLNEGNKNAFLMDMVDEQIDVTTRAFMSLTVSCARCHDHKFDPIPTSEYYSMAGIFRSTQTLYGTRRQNGNRQSSSLIELESANAQQQKAAEKAKAKQKELSGLLADEQKALQQLNKQLQQFNQKNKNKSNQSNKDQGKRLREDVAAQKKTVQEVQRKVNQFQIGNFVDLAMGVRDGRVNESPIYVRGEIRNPKGTAPRGFLTILDPHLKQPILETEQSGRLELAQWITSEQNTLTNRVIVNRVWHHLFGQGIVRSVDNFGATGESPTHPALLDYLAFDFAENGLSIKKLIRKIVLSRTYQLSSNYDENNYSTDPDNFLVWRHNSKRIEAEVLRDSILMASGQLDLDPAMGSPVSQKQGEYGRNTNLADMIRGNNHRTVYLPIIRNAVPDQLKIFDFAEPSIIVGDRQDTTVPTQALFFLNSKFVTQQSDLLAKRILAHSESDEARVNFAYKTVLARPATSREVRKAINFIKQLREELESDRASSNSTNKPKPNPKKRKPNQKKQTVEPVSPEVQAWSGFSQALFGSAEFRYFD